MKRVILIQNTFVGRKRYIAGDVVEVSDELAKHLASLDLAHIQEPAPEPEIEAGKKKAGKKASSGAKK